MVYAAVTRNDLGSLWLKIHISSNIFSGSIHIHIIIEVFQRCKPVCNFDLILFLNFCIIETQNLDVIKLNKKLVSVNSVYHRTFM
jgi:hypothetical protein